MMANRTAPYSQFAHISGVAWYLTTYLAVMFVPPLLWVFHRDETIPRRRRTSGVLIATALLVPPVAVMIAILGAGVLL